MSWRNAVRGAVMAVAGLASAAWAGPLVITPTTITIPPGRHSAQVEIENASDEPVDLQFRAYDWSQPDGADRLTPSDTLVVSPPIATVAPRAKQVFRVLQTAGPIAPGEGERAFRLRLNQLPRAGQGGVAILLEFSLPVFQGEAGGAPDLQWTLRPGEVTVTNRGARRARIGQLALAQAAGVPMPIEGAASAYLLRGARRTFALPPGARVPAAARLVGVSDTGPIDVPATALAAR